MENPYDTGFEDEDADMQGSQGYESSKELLVFLIDAQPDMLIKTDMEDFPSQTYLEVAVGQAVEVLKSRIIASSSDEIAVVFYGTRVKGKHNNFDNIYTFLDLDAPDASRIRLLSNLDAASFQEEIGSREGENVNPAVELKMALWTCSQLFSGRASQASRRILLFTNSEDPCKGIDLCQTYKDQIHARAVELHDSGVTLQLFPIIAAERSFNVDAFWGEILELLKDENDGAGPLNVVTQMAQLIETVKRRTYRKRAFRMLHWALGPGLQLAVQMFNMVQPATKSSAIWLDAKANEPLRSETAYICSDTGAVLTNIDKKYFEVKGADKNRFPKVVMQNQELVKVKSVKPLGMKLLGFKPRSCLQDYHQIRSSHFIYPAEHRIKGSTRLFHAIYLAMITQDRMAVCSYVSRADAMPLLVALIAQPEDVEEEAGYQVTPPGMHMVYLPYADDLRYPEQEPNLVGDGRTQRANEAQVAAAEGVINALTLDPLFSTTADIANPHIQRHYQVLQAVALQEPIPDFNPVEDDQTLPDAQGIVRAGSQIEAFKTAVFGAAGPSAKGAGSKAAGRGAKRKADDENAAAAPQYGQYQWKQLAKSNALDKLKVDELKLYLQHHRLNLSGRKAELLQRIRQHVKG